jgi:hypothetical protein
LTDTRIARGNSLTTQAIDFEGEVNLFHFYLLRSVGKGAFGKVSAYVWQLMRPGS